MALDSWRSFSGHFGCGIGSDFEIGIIMDSKQIAAKIMKQFSIENWENITRTNIYKDGVRWDLLAPLREGDEYRRTLYFIESSPPFSDFSISQVIDYRRSDYTDILNDDDRKTVLNHFQMLETHYQMELKRKKEVKKQAFLKEVFSHL